MGGRRPLPASKCHRVIVADESGAAPLLHALLHAMQRVQHLARIFSGML